MRIAGVERLSVCYGLGGGFTRQFNFSRSKFLLTAVWKVDLTDGGYMDKLMDDLTELMVFFPLHLNEKKIQSRINPNHTAVMLLK